MVNTRPTYTAEQMAEAREAWADFGDEWQPWRRLAANGPGIVYPPHGTRWDSWDSIHPTQRALLVRAIRETPDLLAWAIRGAKEPTWQAVISRLLAGRDEHRQQLDLEEPEPKQDLAPSQSMRRLGEIATIARDSVA